MSLSLSAPYLFPETEKEREAEREREKQGTAFMTYTGIMDRAREKVWSRNICLYEMACCKRFVCAVQLRQRDTATGWNREREKERKSDREDLHSRREGCMTEIEVLGADPNNNNTNNRDRDSYACS